MQLLATTTKQQQKRTVRVSSKRLSMIVTMFVSTMLTETAYATNLKFQVAQMNLPAIMTEHSRKKTVHAITAVQPQLP